MSGVLAKLFGEFLPGNKGNTAAPAIVNPVAPTPQPGSAEANTTVPSSATPASDGKHLAIPVAGVGDKSPIGKFDTLWHPVDSKTTPVIPTSLVPNFEIDKGKIREAAGKVDFTVGMDAALLDKASKGDATALASIINSAAQNAYALGAEATLGVTKNALTEQNARFQAMMPEILRRHTAGNMLGDNPAFSTPALMPIVKAVETALAAQSPNATSADIAAQTKEVMNAMALEIVQGMGGTVQLKDKDAPTVGRGSGQLPSADTNWDQWFNADTTRAA